MALTKTIEVPKIEVVNNWTIQVATDTVIKEDGVELSRSQFKRLLQQRGLTILKQLTKHIERAKRIKCRT